MNWTPRNSINVVLATLCALVIVYVEFFDPSKPEFQSFAIAALAGLLIPGSPIGRGIDALLTTTPKPGDREGGSADPWILVWVVGFFSTLSAGLLLLAKVSQ